MKKNCLYLFIILATTLLPISTSAQSFKDYKMRAMCGDAIAQYKVGVCYANGTEVERSTKDAAYWWLMAAENGALQAQFDIAYCYQYGVGVEENQEEATKWYKIAAEGGHSDAQYCLGLRYSIGEGVNKNDTEAFKWFCKAAEQGDINGLFSVGKDKDGKHKDVVFHVANMWEVGYKNPKIVYKASVK